MKYAIKDLVDIERLRNIFERFSLSTGFTAGLVEYPSHKKFHRGLSESAQCCRESNIFLTEQLTRLKD